MHSDYSVTASRFTLDDARRLIVDQPFRRWWGPAVAAIGDGSAPTTP